MRVTRGRAERLLRPAAWLALLAWVALALLPRGGEVAVADEDLDRALERWTRSAAPAAVHVALDTAPDARSRDWLVALRRAGARVTWSGDALTPMAIEAYPATDPTGSIVVLSAASGTSTVLSDALGPLDSVPPGDWPSATRFAALPGGVELASGGQRARAATAAGRAPRRVFVAGFAGWEARFTIAALEEAGWLVDARLFVAPEHEVVQGTGARAGPDTARHSAVVLLDSSATEAVAGVDAFVRSGGGVVLAGDASRARRAAALVSWRAGNREAAPLGALPDDTSWRGLSRVPLLRGGRAPFVAIETRDGTAIVAARRHHAGRVLGTGYDETWRWRMAGGASSVGDHREWWSRIVSSVAASLPAEGGVAAGSAPLATLHAALGKASPQPDGAGSRPTSLIANLLGLLALGALLGEWLLRRARGAA